MPGISVKSRANRASVLEALYLEHAGRVRWIIRARGAPESSIDDLVHEAFVTMHRRWPERDPDLPLHTWVSSIARNVAFSYRRSEARRRRHLHEVGAPAPTVLPDEAVAERQAWHTLDGFIAGLSPKLREVFVLAEVSGMRISEIGKVTRTPIPTLHSRLRLARRRFSEAFPAYRDARARDRLLRQAAHEITPSKAQQQHSLAALIATIPVGKIAVGAGTVAGASTTGWVVAVTITAAASMVALRASQPSTKPAPPAHRLSSDHPSVDAPPRGRAPTRPTTVPTPAPTDPLTQAAHPPPPPAPVRPVGKPAPPRAKPAVTSDPLATHVEALARARQQLDLGHAAPALATLDAVKHPIASLSRDHQRLTLRAACEATNLPRATAAARALNAVGVATDPQAPCADAEKNEDQ